MAGQAGIKQQMSWNVFWERPTGPGCILIPAWAAKVLTETNWCLKRCGFYTRIMFIMIFLFQDHSQPLLLHHPFQHMGLWLQGGIFGPRAYRRCNTLELLVILFFRRIIFCQLLHLKHGFCFDGTGGKIGKKIFLEIFKITHFLAKICTFL